MATQRRQQGFTLIEIAIVLVIIGLLLGGILKGQELITSARVRSLISQQDGIKAAFYGFQDRYRALPGDYAQAVANINNMAAGNNGNGNGRIENPGTGLDESVMVWDHLSKSGFINGNFNYVSGDAPGPTNTPQNPYGRFVQLVYDLQYYTLTAGAAAVSTVQRHNLKTGNQIPVEIVAEVDRKVDDGNGATGSFVFSTFTGGTALTVPGTAPACMSTAGVWNLTGQTAVDCGGVSLM